MSNLITVFGGGGFIGSHVAEYFSNLGFIVNIPDRSNGLPEGNMGHVIYCCGVGDCTKPHDVLDSHVCLLSEIIKTNRIESITYISSTRLYLNMDSSLEESDIKLSVDDSRKLFNIVKLAGEELCKSSGVPYRIIRSSNVYGPALDSPLFLPSIVRDAVNNGVINMYVTPEYEKDYLSIDNLCESIYLLFLNSQTGTYNVSAGYNTKALDIAAVLKDMTHCKVVWHDCLTVDKFPIIRNEHLLSAVNINFKNVLSELEKMVSQFVKK